MVIIEFCFSTDGDGTSQNRKCLQLRIKNDFISFISQETISSTLKLTKLQNKNLFFKSAPWLPMISVSVNTFCWANWFIHPFSVTMHLPTKLLHMPHTTHNPPFLLQWRLTLKASAFPKSVTAVIYLNQLQVDIQQSVYNLLVHFWVGTQRLQGKKGWRVREKRQNFPELIELSFTLSRWV